MYIEGVYRAGWVWGVGCNGHIALKFDRRLGNAAAGVPVKFQSDWKSQTRISGLRVFARSCGKTSVCLILNWGPVQDFSVMLDNSDGLWASSHSAGAGFLSRCALVHAKLNKRYLSRFQDSSELSDISSWFMSHCQIAKLWTYILHFNI